MSNNRYEFNFGSKTYIMGILNVTPDSFSDGGEYIDLDKAINHANNMIDEGADIIDIGGESTRPGASEVDEEEEIKRVIPVIREIVKKVDIPISVDTTKSKVALEALKAGAHMINDVWGLQKDKNMADVISKYDVPVVIMHNKSNTKYDTDIMESISLFLQKSIQIALNAGIKKKNIILDPGIGFGKTVEQNIEVMKRLEELKELGYPLLLGTSRKSMIGKILDLDSSKRVEGTISTSIIGILKGMDILRVHDIKENYRAVKVADAIIRGNRQWIK